MTQPASYLTLATGTPVHDRLGAPVGDVERVLCHGDGRFDGVVVRTRRGLRFVDAHEVRNIVDGTVVLEITQGEAEAGDSSYPPVRVAPQRGLRRLVRGAARRIPAARWGETAACDRDRMTVVERLKHAYVADRLTTEELADCVARAHDASTLEELEELLRRAEG